MTLIRTFFLMLNFIFIFNADSVFEGESIIVGVNGN
jgi:hypothetical protein